MLPLVTVLLPVYNAADYIAEAIESILHQSYENFEFLIFDDASTDNSKSIIERFAEMDKRIIFYHVSDNQGYLKHLNTGITLAKGRYIARMDADDIALPQRFLKQVEFLEKNPDYGACGCWAETFGAREEIIRKPVEDGAIRAYLFFNSPLVHPAAMIRTSVFTEKNLAYLPEYYTAEDYKLWLEISKRMKLYNLPEVLMRYRWHESNISVKKNDVQKAIACKIATEALEFIGLHPAPREVYLHSFLLEPHLYKDQVALSEIKSWSNKVLYHLYQNESIQKQFIIRKLANSWFYICYNSKGKNISNLVELYDRQFIKANSIDSSLHLKFIVRSLLSFKL